jgi:hypothetical protein
VLYNNKNNKYNNHKVKIDGEVFDSKKEARRYSELKLLQLAGKIRDLETQVKYVLIPAQYATKERYGKRGQRLKDGKVLLEKECAYIADFKYIDVESGELVIEDAKGMRTKYYIIKRKLMLSVYDIQIKEI